MPSNAQINNHEYDTDSNKSNNNTCETLSLENNNNSGKKNNKVSNASKILYFYASFNNIIYFSPLINLKQLKKKKLLSL